MPDRESEHPMVPETEMNKKTYFAILFIKLSLNPNTTISKFMFEYYHASIDSVSSFLGILRARNVMGEESTVTNNCAATPPPTHWPGTGNQPAPLPHSPLQRPEILLPSTRSTPRNRATAAIPADL
jgi:hypothetical protein